MLNKIHKLLKKAEFGIKTNDLDWKMISFKLRQIVAIVPRLVALPFFLVSIALVLIAIVPGYVADTLQKLANKVER